MDGGSLLFRLIVVGPKLAGPVVDDKLGLLCCLVVVAPAYVAPGFVD